MPVCITVNGMHAQARHLSGAIRPQMLGPIIVSDKQRLYRDYDGVESIHVYAVSCSDLGTPKILGEGCLEA